MCILSWHFSMYVLILSELQSDVLEPKYVSATFIDSMHWLTGHLVADVLTAVVSVWYISSGSVDKTFGKQTCSSLHIIVTSIGNLLSISFTNWPMSAYQASSYGKTYGELVGCPYTYIFSKMASRVVLLSERYTTVARHPVRLPMLMKQDLSLSHQQLKMSSSIFDFFLLHLKTTPHLHPPPFVIFKQCYSLSFLFWEWDPLTYCTFCLWENTTQHKHST